MKWNSPWLLVLMVCFGVPSSDLGAQPPPAKVGEVIIVGLRYRNDAEVRGILEVFPGQILDHADLTRGEAALAESGLFKVDSDSGVRPTVRVLDTPGQFKDILVKVEDLPPTLIERYFCPAMMALIVAVMTLLAAGSIWRHYRYRCEG